MYQSQPKWVYKFGTYFYVPTFSVLNGTCTYLFLTCLIRRDPLQLKHFLHFFHNKAVS